MKFLGSTLKSSTQRFCHSCFEGTCSDCAFCKASEGVHMFPGHFKINSSQPAPVQFPSKFKTDQRLSSYREVWIEIGLGSNLIAKLSGEL